jgi:hypothetical protein
MRTLNVGARAAALLCAVVSVMIERRRQPYIGASVSPCPKYLTLPCFEKRLPPGELEATFKFVFGTFGKAAKHFHVTPRTIARWARLSPFPRPDVMDVLHDLFQKKMSNAGDVRNEFNLIRQRPARPRRKLSGCTARYERRP